MSIFLTTASFQDGHIVGTSLAFSEMSSTPLLFWIIIFTTTAIYPFFFKSFYKIIEKLMIGLVILMLVSFLLTLIKALPVIIEILKGFVPSIPIGFEYLIITLTASIFFIVGAFYQPYLVRKNGWKPKIIEFRLFSKLDSLKKSFFTCIRNFKRLFFL